MASSRSGRCPTHARVPIWSAIPRFALHSPSVDPPEDDPSGWSGEAKVAGRAVLAGEVEGEASGQLFHADLHQVVVTKLNDAGDRLLVETWKPGASGAPHRAGLNSTLRPARR